MREFIAMFLFVSTCAAPILHAENRRQFNN
jgi:hypothetical protein